MSPDENLSDKDLTLKTVMLLALTSVKRCSELNLLDTNHMAVGEDKIIFQLAERPKHLRKRGGKPKPVQFLASGGSLCPVFTLKVYLQRESKLFLAFINPHKSVTTSTIGRWLKTVLATVGVDISKFTAHSIRSASSSKSHVMGASVSDILECGNWSNSSTWQKFYNKPVSDSTFNKTQKVLLS